MRNDPRRGWFILSRNRGADRGYAKRRQDSGGRIVHGRTAKAGLAAWAGFTFMCLGMFMAILDVQIVATSLPTIQAALRIPTDQMVWIQTAYLTAEIVAIPLTGYLTDVLGMRRLFVGAVSLFTLASIGCAMSDHFESLILWRVVQGFSGGTLIPIVFSAVFLLFPVRVQGLATTIAGVAAVLAPTIGPIVGGWVTQSFSWHWLFRINIVPGIAAAIGVAWLLRGQAAVERSGSPGRSISWRWSCSPGRSSRCRSG
ncbi:MFS transporter [Sphingomonas sp. I4]